MTLKGRWSSLPINLMQRGLDLKAMARVQKELRLAELGIQPGSSSQSQIFQQRLESDSFENLALPSHGYEAHQ